MHILILLSQLVPEIALVKKYFILLYLLVTNIHFKFALLEEKVLISKMLRNFQWTSHRETNEIPVIAEIITRPMDGCNISINDRMA